MPLNPNSVSSPAPPSKNAVWPAEPRMVLLAALPVPFCNSRPSPRRDFLYVGGKCIIRSVRDDEVRAAICFFAGCCRRSRTHDTRHSRRHHQRICTVAAIENVVAVAAIQVIVAAKTVEHIVAPATRDDVIAFGALECVTEGSADELVPIGERVHDERTHRDSPAARNPSDAAEKSATTASTPSPPKKSFPVTVKLSTISVSFPLPPMN